MTPPKKIYLQLYDEFDGSELDFGDDITWCTDMINDTDVPYILDPAWKPPEPLNESEEE